MDSSELLPLTLSTAVPLWIEELKLQPLPYVLGRGERCTEIIASKGDVILYRSPKKGETAKAFNALAEAVAILSFFPGGVRVFGLHFKAIHPEQEGA